MRLFIDIAHRNSVYDFGATSAGIKESELSLQISKILGKGFEEAGHEVFYSRETEEDVISLKGRTDKANAIANLDWYISIHMNSFTSSSVEGFEVFHYGAHEAMCAKVCTSVCALTKQKNRGAKIATFHVLRETYCKAMLIECGFISNTNERENLLNPAFQHKLVKGILEGFGIVFDDLTTTPLLLNGVLKQVDFINKNDFNYIKLRDLADEKIKVSYDSDLKMPVIEVKNL